MSGVTVFKTWLLLTYDLETGGRSCLAVCNCPFKPNDNAPMYSMRQYHRQKWIEFDRFGNREVRVDFQGARITVERAS